MDNRDLEDVKEMLRHTVRTMEDQKIVLNKALKMLSNINIDVNNDINSMCNEKIINGFTISDIKFFAVTKLNKVLTKNQAKHVMSLINCYNAITNEDVIEIISDVLKIDGNYYDKCIYSNIDLTSTFENDTV